MSQLDSVLTVALEKCLKNLGWPWQKGSISHTPLESSLTAEVRNLVRLMCQTSLLLNSGSHSSERILKILFTPIAQKFFYHFSGSQKTNNVDRPEWCYTQVLDWIKFNCPFLRQEISPVIKKVS